MNRGSSNHIFFLPTQVSLPFSVCCSHNRFPGCHLPPLTIVLSILLLLQLTVSDYHYGIFKLFFLPDLYIIFKILLNQFASWMYLKYLFLDVTLYSFSQPNNGDASILIFVIHIYIMYQLYQQTYNANISTLK